MFGFLQFQQLRPSLPVKPQVEFCKLLKKKKKEKRKISTRSILCNLNNKFNISNFVPRHTACAITEDFKDLYLFFWCLLSL
jgi:hypothetical protein